MNITYILDKLSTFSSNFINALAEGLIDKGEVSRVSFPKYTFENKI